jgi:hypothetical protein
MLQWVIVMIMNRRAALCLLSVGLLAVGAGKLPLAWVVYLPVIAALTEAEWGGASWDGFVWG